MIWDILLVVIGLGIVLTFTVLARMFLAHLKNKRYWDRFLDNMR